MGSVDSAARLGNAQDLGGLQGAALTQWPWGADTASKPSGKFELDAAAKERIVVQAFTSAVNGNPGLLDKPIAEAARFISVPPAALQTAFEKLAAQTNGQVKLLDKDGNPRSMGDILRSVPQGQAAAIVSTWYKSLPPAVQQVLVGVGIGAVLAAEGPKGLAQRFNLGVTLVKGKNGKLEVSLVPDPKGAGVQGKLSGELKIPLDKNGQISLSGSVRTDGAAQIAAGLKLALGKSAFTLSGTAESGKTGTLDGALAVPLGGGNALKLGVSLGDKPITYSAGVGGKNWSVAGQINDQGYRVEGKLQLSF